MQRAIQHVVDLAVFNDPARIHHRYIVSKTGYN
jgi:hypothetical protein